MGLSGLKQTSACSLKRQDSKVLYIPFVIASGFDLGSVKLTKYPFDMLLECFCVNA